MLSFLTNHKQFVAVTLASLLILVAFLKHKLVYWKNKNVPYQYLGNFRNVTVLMEKSYHHFKSAGCRFFGAFLLTTPMLVVVDLELIKTILTKRYDHFTSHGIYYNEKDDPLSANLFSLEGSKWKNLRSKFTPTFTSGKMKIMFQTLLACSKQLVNFVGENVEKGKPLNIKEVLACFTTDVIGSCAFGLECNSFVESDSKIRNYGRKLFEINFFKAVKDGLQFLFPDLSRSLGMKSIKSDVSSFFFNIIKETVDYREKNNVTRKDFLQLLIELKNTENLDKDIKKEFEDTNLTIEQIAGQSVLFFIGGFETSATTMTFCLYELSQNLDIQEKVRNEFKDVLSRHNGEITYDALMEMTYMQQVINETLRKYPPVPFLPRKCTADFIIPDTNMKIEKGINVFIPTYQIHHDKEYYPEPEEFKPERFSEENKKKIPQYAFLPFGEGPRICIGLRFAIMQIKVGLTKLLTNYEFKLNPKTPTFLQFDPNNLILSALENIYLDATKIN